MKITKTQLRKLIQEARDHGHSLQFKHTDTTDILDTALQQAYREVSESQSGDSQQHAAEAVAFIVNYVQYYLDMITGA